MATQPKITDDETAALEAAAVAMRDIAAAHGVTCISMSYHATSGSFYSANVHDRFKSFGGERVEGYTLATLIEDALRQHAEDHPTEIERARRRAKEAADDAERAAAVLRELEAEAA